MIPIFMNWEASSSSGWGVVGLNLFYHWVRSARVEPMMLYPIDDDAIRLVDPLRKMAIREQIHKSNELATRIKSTGKKVALDLPVIHPVGNCFESNDTVTGRINVGRVVFEDTNIEPHLHELEKYDALLCASQWNVDLLKHHSDKPIYLVHEAVDPSLFYPAPKSGVLAPEHFYIFTGGKIEYRKGQDLILLAFKEFSQRHPDAILVTSWQTPFTEMSEGFQGNTSSPIQLTEDGAIDVKRWVGENGIDPTKVIDIGHIPNQLMPMVLREMDCAIQPSRAEAATNMVVKEEMACGLPVVLTLNTGLKDIANAKNCMLLEPHTISVDANAPSTNGWGEARIDDMVAALESLYASQQLRESISEEASHTMKARTWAQHAAQVEDLILNLLAREAS